MKIVLFIDKLAGGGAERQISEMARLFDKYGNDVSVVTYSDVPDQYKVPASVSRIRLADNCNSKILRRLKIYNFFLHLKCDAVISFFPLCTKLVVLPARFRLHPFKIIAGERSLSPNKEALLKKKEYINSIYKYVDFIVPNSYAQCHQLLELDSSIKDKLVVINNYANLDLYSYSKIPNNNVLQLLILARYQESKNCMRFAEAVNKLKNYSKVPFKIYWFGNKHILGGSIEPLFVEMSNYIIENNLQDVLILNDRIDDVSKIMSESDSIVLPSISEGFSNVIAEGICCGRPILAGDIADNKVMVKNGINGFLFNPLDVDDMFNKLYSFINLPYDQRNKMGIESRKHAETLFAETDFVNKYLDLIN